MSEPVAKSIILCNFALQDRANRWSLIAIFDTLYMSSLPMKAAPFFTFVRICDVPQKGAFLVSVENPQGIVIWTSGSMPYTPEGDSRNVENLFSIPEIVVTMYGSYRVSVYVNSDPIAETQLLVQSQVPVKR